MNSIKTKFTCYIRLCDFILQHWGNAGAGSSFCSIPGCLTTPEAGCSDSFMGPPLANYVSRKQHKQAGAKQADGNMSCLAAVVMFLLWMVFVG